MVDYDTALLNFLAAFAGVGLAFFLTLRYDRWKKHNDEKEACERMLSSIKKELQTNHDFLKELDAVENYPGANMFLWTDAYQSAVNGGDIQLFEPTLQTKLAMIYLDFKQIDRYGQKLLEMFGKGFDKPYSDVLELMKKTVKTTLLHLPKALEFVDVELGKLVTPRQWRFWVHRRESITSSSSGKVMDKDTERMKGGDCQLSLLS